LLAMISCIMEDFIFSWYSHWLVISSTTRISPNATSAG
jgi:hypothetical protein